MNNNPTFRTVFKGYHKMQVLVRVDALNVLILAVSGGDMSREEALKEAASVMRKPLQTAWRGFAREDVDAYLAQLMQTLQEGTA